jgi:hypothetical protein
MLAFVLMIAGAQAASAGSDPCAKFSDADAYNNCLAGFGPVAGQHELSRAPPDEVRPDAHGRAAGRKSAGRKSAPQARRQQSRGRTNSDAASGPVARPLPHGRMRLEIMVPSRE